MRMENYLAKRTLGANFFFGIRCLEADTLHFGVH